MKNVIGSMVAIAGLAVVANAQTRMDILLSKDGVNWSPSVSVNHAAGDSGRVLVAYAVSYTGTANTVGFASLTFQPVFANVRVGADALAPYILFGNNTNGGASADGAYGDTSVATDGPFGRRVPFASTGPTGPATATTNNARHFTHVHTAGSNGAPAGNYFRIARNDVTRWMGTGPTTTSNAVNNFNGAGGIAAVQKSSGNVGSADPAFDSRSQGVIIAIYAIDVAPVAQGDSHTIIADAPTDGMSRNTVTGAREASWFASAADNSGSVKGTVSVNPGEINIVPAPGALALLGLGGLVAGRRRR